MPNGQATGKSGEYYTTKGQGSQDVYDAYYDDYGTSTVWQVINVDTQSNINSAMRGGERPFVTTAESIERALPRGKSNLFLYILIGLGAYYSGIV